MKSEILELQNEAVAELVRKTRTLTELTFRAPTGSGKTYMMAKFMDAILSENEDVVFLVSTLSKGGLAKQNHDKFIEYGQNGFVKNLNPYLINTEVSVEERLFIPTTYNVYSLPRDLYKKGGKLMQGSMDAFLQELKSLWNLNGSELSLGLNKQIYLIRDESHQATNNLDTLSSKYFTKIFNFSATPKLQRKQEIDVMISDEEAQNVGLIKRVEWGKDNDSFSDAIRQFKKIKDSYNKHLNVHPCMIVQISNKNKAEEEWNNIIKPALDANQDLKWMLIVDKLKDCDTNDVFKKKNIPLFKWKEYAKSNQDTTDIIIFKLAISEGWDIPRACMLYQVRDTESKQLDEQVMGRVRRNPRLTDFETLSDEAQKLATTAWVWGIVPSEVRTSYEVNLFDKKIITDNLKVKTTRIKNLKNKNDFDISIFMNNIKNDLVYDDIFTLYRRFNASNNSIRELGQQYSDDVSKWFKFNQHINEVKQSCNEYYCDYQQSMILNTDDKGSPILESLPETSYYMSSEFDIGINNWVWIKRDNSEDFHFDSDAEKKWANILMQLCSENVNQTSRNRAIKELSPNIDNRFLWGKNYLYNSNIKYEYYLNGISFSYPDFILKDSYGRIHIFEVKSLNKSNRMDIDQNEYKEKVLHLKECYKYASRLTGHIFYLPILSGSEWSIIQFKNGEEKMLRKDQFVADIKTSDEPVIEKKEKIWDKKLAASIKPPLGNFLDNSDDKKTE